ILRIAESLLLKINEHKSSQPQQREMQQQSAEEVLAMLRANAGGTGKMSVLELAKSVRELAVRLIAETNHASHEYVQTLDAIVNTYRRSGGGISSDGVESKMIELENKILTDVEYIITNIQEAATSLVPTLQLLHVVNIGT
ncbi:hypothetical protein HK102_008432, partial [Quaeritorhiza haematococci]